MCIALLFVQNLCGLGELVLKGLRSDVLCLLQCLCVDVGNVFSKPLPDHTFRKLVNVSLTSRSSIQLQSLDS